MMELHSHPFLLSGATTLMPLYDVGDDELRCLVLYQALVGE